jgi:thiosulfate dehydrogenase [quinone] large subunit
MTDSEETQNGKNRLDLTLAYLALRLFLGCQLLLAGIDKFVADGKFGGFGTYTGNMTRIAEGIAGGSMLPLWMTKPYALILPWLLLLAGLAILLGIKNRIALFVAALTYTSLSLGLASVREEEGVFRLGLYVGLCAIALCLNRYNRFALLKDKSDE